MERGRLMIARCQCGAHAGIHPPAEQDNRARFTLNRNHS
jgi:hypothetical protein